MSLYFVKCGENETIFNKMDKDNPPARAVPSWSFNQASTGRTVTSYKSCIFSIAIINAFTSHVKYTGMWLILVGLKCPCPLADVEATGDTKHTQANYVR